MAFGEMARFRSRPVPMILTVALVSVVSVSVLTFAFRYNIPIVFFSSFPFPCLRLNLYFHQS